LATIIRTGAEGNVLHGRGRNFLGIAGAVTNPKSVRASGPADTSNPGGRRLSLLYETQNIFHVINTGGLAREPFGGK
jgi:hypothetical protein